MYLQLHLDFLNSQWTSSKVQKMEVFLEKRRDGKKTLDMHFSTILALNVNK